MLSSVNGPSARGLTLRALGGIGEVQPGQALDRLLFDALESNDVSLRSRDVIAVCQKIVSKSEGRYVDLTSVTPGREALARAAQSGKDPRYVEVVLSESTAVVRCVKGVLIVRHRLGMVMANAGIDQSNIENGDSRVLMLPQNPDLSAARLRQSIHDRYDVEVGVVITDSFGRAWRNGVCGICIGCAGFEPLQDQRGRKDRHGRALRITQVAVADQIAAAATLVMGEADEGLPLVICAGLADEHFIRKGSSNELLRSEKEDLFT